MEEASGAEYERLEALIGKWKTQGWTKETPAAEIDAVDTYEWAPGGFALLPVSTPRWATKSSRGPRASATTLSEVPTSLITAKLHGHGRSDSGWIETLLQHECRLNPAD